ncbi:STM4014 family protein [Streptomyces sp. NPDC019396]|uniref:STM4014 family protein n=1 Tax=Streptomyces sp. NPDC019396 TaxID=3154687 RepID=UPI0033D3A869
MTTAPPRFAVVGNPENRRVRLFQDAVRAAGLPDARVVPWLDVLRGRCRFLPDEWVRIDSPGENAEVDFLLRGVRDPSRVEGGARWYRSFNEAAGEVAVAVRDAGGTLLDDPGDLAVLFDKRLCHERLAVAGVAVPPSPTSGRAPVVGGWEDVRGHLAEPAFRRAFVKPAHGSSASGVLAVEAASGGRVHAVTSVERAPDGRLFNSLRLRRYTSESEVAAIVDALAPDGLHIERWLPKAVHRARATDLRVVVVAGKATHAVVRTSRSPLTNLHLGGERGDLAEAMAAVRAAGRSWPEHVLGLCERAAALFPGRLCVGVDVLPATAWRRFTVGEVNAFGDLLPRLTGLPGSGAAGLDTYAAQVAAAITSHHKEPPCARPLPALPARHR